VDAELAESWRLLNDTTWQFKLRRGVLFHDGEPFNAEAVRFTLERVLNPEQKSPNRANIAEVARIDVVDELAVNLVTSRPYAPLLNRLIDFPILPPRYTTEKGNQGQASSSRPSTVTGGACLRSRGSSSGRSRSRSRGRRRCATARWT